MHRHFAIVTALMVASSAHGASTVYNNTTTPLGTSHALLPANEVNSPEHGNTVTLSGYQRIVTSITLKMHIGGPGAASYKLRGRLYRNDGDAGKPGTLLWDSGPLFAVIDAGPDIPYTFNVSNIRVPDSVMFSAQITDRAIFLAAPIGPGLGNPPSVGSAPFGYWANLGTVTPDWTFVNSAEPPWSARVDANPIPGDVDHNARVNINDLVQVITHWGACGDCTPANCTSDVDGDCQVGMNDLVSVITNWG